MHMPDDDQTEKRAMRLPRPDELPAAFISLLERDAVKEVYDVAVRQTATAAEKAIAYTNLLSVAGYASFFALLSAAGDDIPDGNRRAAILSMALSILLFVGFEIAKMITLGRDVQRRAAAAAPNTSQTFTTMLDNLAKAEQRERIAWLRLNKFWLPLVIAEITLSMVAVVALLYPLAKALLLGL